MPHAVERLGRLIKCADKWWTLQGEEERLQMMSRRDSMTDPELRAKLESSYLGNAHVVFATLSSAARLRPCAARNEPFGVVVVDEAAQATEPSTVVPLEFARSRRCILVGDDRQLPPTVFAS